MSEPADSSPNLEELTPEEASRIIHSHRKVRYGTACWPCRQRKVKCDNQQPCENCVKRDHAQLCSYRPNRGKQGSLDSEKSRKRALSPDETDEGRSGADKRPDTSIKVDSDSCEVTRYLGQNSIPALLKEQTSPNAEEEGIEVIRHDMRSIFGLDNSAPFPLMSATHLDRLTKDVASELPADREVMKLFRTYKETIHQFWGFVVDVDDMESRLMVYLEDRAKNAKNAAKPTRSVSASWLAILFAVMAVASQYHDEPYHIRTRDSQRYIQVSFHFLRLGNFMLRPNLDSIQALTITGFVLINDMKAEASWALLGLTCRLAQSIGLDRSPQLSGREPPEFKTKEMMRRKMWWTCVWHDVLSSLSFDRNPMVSIKNCPIPLRDDADQGWNYLEAMYHLHQIIFTRLNPEAANSASYAQILETCEEVQSIRGKMLLQLRNKDACKSALDRLQHFAIRLHTSFITSVSCRPGLRRDESRLDAGQKSVLATKCKENLTETVRMFLAMYQLSVIPTRSWAFTYHGLSSALLLGILGETKTDPEVRQLQHDLISALSATTAKEQSDAPEHIQKTDKDIELSGPLSRALTALKSIYDHGAVVVKNVKKEEGRTSGNRTPLQFAPQAVRTADAANASNAGNPLGGPFQPGLDPHQDAALAMAEMQNGAAVADLTGNYTYLTGAQPPALGMADFSTVDSTTHMSPMDLYESIFWDAPDPWNTMGMDSMNFDFVAQPPPGQSEAQFYF